MNQQTVLTAQQSLGTHSHFDSGRSDLIKKIKVTLPEHRFTIDWLLSGDKWGALPPSESRNTALLLSVGKKALVIDDDVIPKAITPPLAQEKFRFSSANDREAVFYSSF